MAHIVLVGMMGSGKSTVGHLVADRLGRPFVDCDEAIEHRAGRPIPEIFAAAGEEAFRDLEHEVLHDILMDDTWIVLAAGGGVVLRAENRKLLTERAHVVWLRADLATLAGRVGSGHGRPLLQEDPATELRNIWVERAPLYEDIADAVVDVDDRRPADIAELIA